MALRAVISSKVPMVIILGATGTGKTKLSVELAQKFVTEVISADSMQIYKGLDVVTAKASAKEREMAPHHLLDILEPHQMFTVVDFRNRALKIIDNLTEQGKIPIVVGGTNYYIESIVYKILVENMDDGETLLWDKSRRKRNMGMVENIKEIEDKAQLLEDKNTENIMDSESREDLVNLKSTEHSVETKNEDLADLSGIKSTEEVSKLGNTEDLGENIEEPSTSAPVKIDFSNFQITKEQLQRDYENEAIFTNEEIHAKLSMIDRQMARRLHPNNRRKVLRSIEVWLKTGRLHSEILAEQKLSEGQLRKPDSTIIFWLKCEQSIHDQRLNSRVDSMIEEGLIQELLDFHDKHNKQRIKDGKPPDYTKGVFQTLGFKEFHEYLMLSDEERNTDAGKKLLEQSIENMKMGTRRYARRQNKMIRGRFLEHPTREVPPIYELDTTDISKWDEEVKNKAIHIVESYVNEKPCEYTPVKSVIDDVKKGIDGNSHNYCEVCKRIFIGDNVYAIHLESFRHKKVLKKMKRLEEQRNRTEAETKISNV
ncbi:tRNA dimethylallyltransferase-like [Spodoptera litura]|uniref:tRNA dimethylallyltransferase-like n=1 Tax=Spodoptera litura TaxID=69820 RepID=A0A9J7IZB8_SPOLT|nr:tRNA dimethylallyltransferase-like [Spodoptera litura]